MSTWLRCPPPSLGKASSVAAAITGASILFFSASQQREAQDAESLDDVENLEFLVSQTSQPLPLPSTPSAAKLLPLCSQHKSSKCGCEGTASLIDSPRRPSIRTLLRRRTIRRMNLSSTKGQTLESRYDIDWNSPPLGEGAFGLVHLATARDSGEPVALKKITKKLTDEECFQREMRALLHIRSCGGHPNICSLRENFDEGGYYYLILDFISGGELFDHLINNGAYSEADAARLVREVASALAFLHGVGVVHADLKPENLMLSTSRRADSVVKLVDFGGAEVIGDEDLLEQEDDLDLEGISIVNKSEKQTKTVKGNLTPAYCPPEALSSSRIIEPPMDMWSLGVILYIILTGVHPYDLSGDAPDDVVENRILNEKTYCPPIRGSRYTSHLSESAIDLIEKLLDRNPRKRLTAFEMLEHPWVRGQTAKKGIMAGSDERLRGFRVFKSKMQAKFFHDVVKWSDDEDEIRRKTCLIERSFRSLDTRKEGYLTTKELGKNFGANTEEDGGSISMSDFHGLLSENMKNMHFRKGQIIYNQGDIGNHMYFINSGTVEVTTKDGSKAVRTQGDFFGEGALLHPKKIRSATIRCKTPVHAMQISREYFEKYLASSDSQLLLTLKEKDKIRKRNRAKTILRLQKNVKEMKYDMGDVLFEVGEDGDNVYLLESGKVDLLVEDKKVFSVLPGNVCGEHSLITGQPRNSTALCVSEAGCVSQAMSARDFMKLLDLSPHVKESLTDLCLRRDFKKAVVFRLRKEFPYANPREAFNAVDVKKCGLLDAESIGNLMREMNADYSDEEIEEIVKTLDLTGSGTVDFDEFCKVFVGNIRTSASM